MLWTGNSGAPLGGTAVDPWVKSLGGNTKLLDRAEEGHQKLDGFKPEEVDYQIVVGTGVPTITSMKIAVNDLEPEQWVQARYGSGDGTVPATSQTQGAYPATTTPEGVGIPYACRIKHAEEPGNEVIEARIKQFVLNGGEITGENPAGSGLTLSVRSLDNGKEGEPRYYQTSGGTVTIGPLGAVLHGKRRLRASRPGAAPHVTARVKKQGRRYRVQLRAAGHGLAGIYTRIGKGAPRRYFRPLLLTAAQVKSLRFAGVSAFGVWERPQRAHLPH